MNVSEQFERAHSVFDSVVKIQGAVALLDFPSHSNVGDSAIWLGEMSYLRKIGVAPVYFASEASFSEKILRKTMPSGTLLLHGGGNFGTLWPAHQIFREKLLLNCRDYKIIQLPQTIFFLTKEDWLNALIW